jgi:hypothetical protein
MAESATACAQQRLDALALQLAPAQRRRRALLKSRDARFELVDLEHHPVERVEALIEHVDARPDAFEQSVQQPSRLRRHCRAVSPRVEAYVRTRDDELRQCCREHARRDRMHGRLVLRLALRARQKGADRTGCAAVALQSIPGFERF